MEGKNVNEAGVLLSEQTTVTDVAYQQQILQYVGETPQIQTAEAEAVVIALPHVSTTHHNAA